MLSRLIVFHPMSLGLPDKAASGVANVQVLLAAGAILLKPALDSFLISDFPDSQASATTLSGRIGDVTYSKGLTLLEPAVKGYQHHDIVAPFQVLRTTQPILSSMPLLQPYSMTAASGVMFGITACFLSLVAAGTFLVRSHAGSEPGHGHGESGGRSSSSLSEILAYNREQRQAQNGRTARRNRRRREFYILFVPAILADKIHFDVFAASDPMPPNNNQNNIPTEDIKPPAHSKSHFTNHLLTDCSLH